VSRRRQGPTRDQALTACRMAMAAAIPAWQASRDAGEALAAFRAAHPELEELTRQYMVTMQRANEFGLALDRHMRELIEADPELGERFREALTVGVREALEVLA